MTSALYYGLSFHTIEKDMKIGVEEVNISPMNAGGEFVGYSVVHIHKISRESFTDIWFLHCRSLILYAYQRTASLCSAVAT